MKIKIILFSILIIQNAKAELSATAGHALLESFRCESTGGSSVQNVRSTLSTLKTTLDKIAEQQKECMNDFAAVGKLPEIESILSQIENHGASEEIKRQENVIMEALTDLAKLRELPAGHRDRGLYPNESTLQAMVSQARADLVTLRADYGVDRAKADRSKYIDGVRQLDALATELTSALQKNSQCFEKNPIVKRQVLGGLVGIAGFFADTPIGIGITLAGRVLQSVFDIRDSSRVNENRNFEASQQALLAAGMSCTIENLAAQHCKLVRQKSLLEHLKSPSCQGNSCPPEFQQLQTLVASGKTASEAVANVTDWLGGRSQSAPDKAMAAKINRDFENVNSTFETTMSKAEAGAPVGQASPLAEAQEQSQVRAVVNATRAYASDIYGQDLEVNDPQNYERRDPSKEPIEMQSLFTEDEKEKHVLNLIFTDQEFEALLAETAQQINASPRLRQRFKIDGPNGSTGSFTADEIALVVLQKSFAGENFADIPASKKVKERLGSREVFDRARDRVAEYKSQINGRTAAIPNEEQLSNFLMAFQQQEIGKLSVLKNLENVQIFFNSLPQDYLKSRDQVLGLSRLKKEIDDVVDLGKSMESGDAEITKEKVTELMAKTNSLLDPARGIKEKIASVATSAASYQTQKISSSVSNPEDISDLVFMQNKDFLEQIYDIRNPYEKEVDTKTAIALSASQIDAFGRFYENYMDPAFQGLNGKSIKDKRYSDGLSQNIDRSLKDHFCVQALGLTAIPDKVKKECQGAIIKMGVNELRFSDYLTQPHQSRVCAYKNFLNKVDIESGKRSSGVVSGEAGGSGSSGSGRTGQ